MDVDIVVTFDPKTNRLVFKAPFHMVDVLRGFPSRRFDPKSKLWKMPLVKANIAHLRSIYHLYSFKVDTAAQAACADYETLSAGPKYEPFPRHIYDFKKSALKYDPMPHQDKMLDLAWGLKACAWFAKMGTGKTFSAVHLAMARWAAGQIDGVMIICPSTLRRTWLKELAKYATYPYDFRIHDTKAPWLKEFYARKVAFGGENALPILAVSVEGLGVSEALYDSACGFFPGRRVLVICDESSRIKNPAAKRTERTITLGSAAEYRLILNGTPIALGIQDLWSQYEFLDPNIIGCGDYWSFKTRYIVMGGFVNQHGKPTQVIGIQNVEELMKAIIPYTCEVGKDVLNLPPKVMKSLFCEATKVQKALFRLIIKGPTGDPNEPIIKVENVLERSLRLRQVVGGYLPRGIPSTKMIDGIECEVIDTVIEPLKDNPKIALLLDMIEGNYAGTKFIIWTTFVHEIEHIRDILAAKFGAETVECYYGKTAMDDRSRIEDRYCNDSSMRFFIGNPVAAGLGLTLISGENDVMVYYSGTSAYIDRAQSEDRAHRIGQQNSVAVIDLVMERTIDEIIMASIGEKMNIEEYLMTRIAQGVDVDSMMLG